MRTIGVLLLLLGVLLIESVEPVELEDLSEQAAREAGYASRHAALQHLTGTEGSIYRIGFRVAGEDAGVELRDEVPPDRSGFEAARGGLERLDRKSPWTRGTRALTRPSRDDVRSDSPSYDASGDAAPVLTVLFWLRRGRLNPACVTPMMRGGD